MWYAQHRGQQVGATPSLDDTALSLPIGASPRHLPGPLPGGPPQSS